MLLLLACSEYGLSEQEEKLDGTLPVTSTFVPDTGSTVTDACPDLPELTSTSAIDESCITVPTVGPLDAVVEWSRSNFGEYPEYTHVLVTPVVGQLDDDDGDGDIDRADIPDIVVIADDNGEDNEDKFGLMAVLRGSDGNVTMTFFGVDAFDAEASAYRYATPALADLDADGIPEIITLARVIAPPGEGGGVEPTPDTAVIPDDVPVGPPPPGDESGANGCALVAFHVDGTAVWRSETALDCEGDMISVADLDGDGSGEILAGNAVFNSVGGLLWEASSQARFAAYTEVGKQPVAMDMDGDGSLEVLFGTVLYDATGDVRCEVPEGSADGFPAVADLDGDGRGEFVLVGGGQAAVYEDDCTATRSWALAGTGNGGPATIADFDADGIPELGIADADTYSVYEVDGTVVWSATIEDSSSHATGSSVFDFDGDGRAEALYGDETTLWIFDGSTGDVRLADTNHTSRTLHELPVAVDADNDGQMEIVVPNGGGHHGSESTGVYLLGSDSAPWRGDRQVWNQHAYSITNIERDLKLPIPAEANWPFANTFRSGTLGASAGGGALPDAVPYVQTCTVHCADGRIGVEVKVGNQGMAALRDDLPVSVYAVDGAEETLVHLVRTTAPVEPGGASDTINFELLESQIPTGKIVVRVDDRRGVEQVRECAETNNEVIVEDLRCE